MYPLVILWFLVSKEYNFFAKEQTNSYCQCVQGPVKYLKIEK